MVKKKYESPTMTLFVVEMEKGFMKGSIIDEKGRGTKVSSSAQDYEEIDSNGFATEANDKKIIEWE